MYDHSKTRSIVATPAERVIVNKILCSVGADIVEQTIEFIVHEIVVGVVYIEIVAVNCIVPCCRNLLLCCAMQRVELDPD